MTDRPTVVVGLDGAGFELIEPWIEAGHLPNLERVVETGVRGDLESVLPPVTSPNWKAYATGRNPGQFGIFWWENVDTANRRVHYPAERKHEHRAYWSYLGDGDEPGCDTSEDSDPSVAVVNVPLTYPPRPLDGVLVAGAPDGEDEDYTYPPELEADLRERFDYRALKRRRLDDDVDAAAGEIYDLIDSRFQVAADLFERHDLDFLQVTTFYLNSLHHFLWDDERTRRAWELVDVHLGRYLDAGCNVVLMSDHGSTPIRTVFHVNAWLEREGYLATGADIAEALHGVGVNKDRLLRLADRLAVGALVKRLAPRWLLGYVPAEDGTVNREGKTDTVDWEATTALASGQGPVYLTLDRDHPEYERTREELADRLREVTDPDGRPVARAVHRGEDIYHGRYLDEAPDLVIEQADGIHVPGGIGRDDVFTRPEADGWRAENKRTGLFAATGPDFGSGTVEGLSILDLAPTLLYLHGRAIPDGMDGEVRPDVFSPDSSARERDPERRVADPRERELDRVRAVARAHADRL